MGEAWVAFCAAVWLTALSAYDIRQRLLPNILTLPGAAAVLIAAAVADRGSAAATGALVLFGVYLVVHLVSPSAMGAGDVKLAIGVGALTGAFGGDVWTLAAVTAPVVTAVWAIAGVVRDMRTTVPHGFSMCLTAGVSTALGVA